MRNHKMQWELMLAATALRIIKDSLRGDDWECRCWSKPLVERSRPVTKKRYGF
jgi:hypothetical protein